VVRLNERLDERFVRSLGRDFRDILVGADVVQTRALVEEEDEPELADLPRLVLPFSRSHFGRLRQLIDRLNLEG
jgi:hypothetical protein